MISFPPSFTVTTHSLADVDGLASALLLARRFGGRVILRDHPVHAAKVLARRLGLDWEIGEPQDPVIAVDTSSRYMVGRDDVYMLIDHHEGDLRAQLVVRDTEAPSTTYLIYKRFVSDPDPTEASLILAGMISDTYRFKVGRRGWFEDVALLLQKSALAYDELVSLVEKDMTFSERLTFLRSFSSYRLVVEGDRIGVVTDCQSYPSLVASRIVDCMGADACVAYLKRSDGFHVSVYTRNEVSAYTIAKHLSGGKPFGGHEHAVGLLLEDFDEGDAVKALRNALSL